MILKAGKNTTFLTSPSPPPPLPRRKHTRERGLFPFHIVEPFEERVVNTPQRRDQKQNKNLEKIKSLSPRKKKEKAWTPWPPPSTLTRTRWRPPWTRRGRRTRCVKGGPTHWGSPPPIPPSPAAPHPTSPPLHTQVETLLLDTAALYSGAARPPPPPPTDADADSGDALLAAALAAGDAVLAAAVADEPDAGRAAAERAAGALHAGGGFDVVAAAVFEGEKSKKKQGRCGGEGTAPRPACIERLLDAVERRGGGVRAAKGFDHLLFSLCVLTLSPPTS